MIKLERFDQITPAFVKELRESMNMTLAEFWGAIGCRDTRGFRYEASQSKMQEDVKRLLFLHYGVGIPTDCQSPKFHQFVEFIRTKGTLQDAVQVMQALAEQRATENQDELE